MRPARALFALASSMVFAACSAAPPQPCPPAQTVFVSTPPPPISTAAAFGQEFGSGAAPLVFVDPERRKKLEATFPAMDALAESEMKKQRSPSMVLGIVIDGDLAYAKGFGVADPVTGAKPDADTLYRIGSITKSFTSLTILALRDDGALGLDDPVARWIPEAAGLVYPTRDASQITLRQLLTHTSGLPRSGAWEGAIGPAEETITRTLKGFALETAPGTQHSYSNMGFALLGLVVGHAGHARPREVITKRLIAPLGMTSTVWDRDKVPQGKLATCYVRGPKGEPQAAEAGLAGPGEPAGGIFSSVRDMAKYVAFQLAAYPPRDAPETGPIRRATVREAHTTGFRSGLSVRAEDAPAKGDPLLSVTASGYGFGWVQQQTCAFDDLVFHNGLIDGYTADIRFLPSRGVGVIAMGSFSGSDPAVLSNKVLNALAKSGALSKRTQPASPLLDAAMKKLLAVYNTWDDAAYAAMLTAGRPPYPKEKEELATYKSLHGECRSFAPFEVESPRSARFRLECERGTFQMQIALSDKDNLIAGFTGKSLAVDAPKPLRAAADHLLSLVTKWDPKLWKKHLEGKAKRPAATGAIFEPPSAYFDRVHAAHGACTVKSAVHEGYDYFFELDCERGGDMRLDVGVDPKDENAITSYAFKPSQRGMCPVR